MKTIPSITLIFVALLGSPLFAFGDTDCSNESFSEVNSLSKLPGEIGELLGKSISGTNGIADRGEKFNITDVVFEQLPFRRFNLAAISSNCVFAAIEHGGRGYYIELWKFRRDKDKWSGIQLQNIHSLPNSYLELISHAN
ncbi:MAG: hypothetical protein ABI536_06620 [Gallionella sp.]